MEEPIIKTKQTGKLVRRTYVINGPPSMEAEPTQDDYRIFLGYRRKCVGSVGVEERTNVFVVTLHGTGYCEFPLPRHIQKHGVIEKVIDSLFEIREDTTSDG